MTVVSPLIDGKLSGIDTDYSSLPHQRLNDLCYEVAVAEQIRSIQTMYRDHYLDESALHDLLIGVKGATKPSGVKSNDQRLILSQEFLTKKCLEGRSRINALTKLSYGDDSIEYMRSNIDQINTFALMGQWATVHELIEILLMKYMHLQSKQSYFETLQAKDKALKSVVSRMSCCYSLLRQHVVDHRGQVTSSFPKQLTKAFKDLKKSTMIEDTNNFDSFLDEAIGDDSDEEDEAMEEDQRLVHEIKEFIDSYHSRAIQLQSNEDQGGTRRMSRLSNRSNRSTLRFQCIQSNKQPNKPSASPLYPSWGEMINFFRYDSKTMRLWISQLNESILPQIKCVLKLAFDKADLQRRGIANPKVLIANIFHAVPSCAKIIPTTQNEFISYLSSMKSDVSFILRPSMPPNQEQETPIDDPHHIIIDISSDDLQSMKTLQGVSYELPVTWEEVLCQYCTSTVEFTESMQYNSLLKGQLLTTLGVCHLFYQENMNDAEEALKEALRQYESMGLQDSILSCELYNAIAQLMINKYKHIEKAAYLICEAKAMEWMNSIDGQMKLKRAIINQRTNKLIKGNYTSSHIQSNQGQPVVDSVVMSPAADMARNEPYHEDLRQSNPGEFDLIRMSLNDPSLLYKFDNNSVKNHLLKEKLQELLAIENESNKKSIEAAFRYLIRSYEILEQYHGLNHIIIATSCIAIASVKNTIKDYEIAREWLTKALKILTKLNSNQKESIDSSHGHDNNGVSHPNPIKYTDHSQNFNQKSHSFYKSSPHDTIPSDHDSFEIKTFNHGIQRVVAFVQIQLAHIMFRSLHEEEGLLLLSNACSYHIKKAFSELELINKTTMESQYTSVPISKSSPVFEDVQLAIVLTSRLVHLLGKHTMQAWDAVEYSEAIAKLSEVAFGYDSIQAAERRRQVLLIVDRRYLPR